MEPTLSLLLFLFQTLSACRKLFGGFVSISDVDWGSPPSHPPPATGWQTEKHAHVRTLGYV